jgi:hypothetical protein
MKDATDKAKSKPWGVKLNFKEKAQHFVMMKMYTLFNLL